MFVCHMVDARSVMNSVIGPENSIVRCEYSASHPELQVEWVWNRTPSGVDSRGEGWEGVGGASLHACICPEHVPAIIKYLAVGGDSVDGQKLVLGAGIV